MTADEMFEALDYEHQYETDCYVVYRLRGLTIVEIAIDLKNKNITKYESDYGHFVRGLTFNEFKAVNKKFEELGI